MLERPVELTKDSLTPEEIRFVETPQIWFGFTPAKEEATLKLSSVDFLKLAEQAKAIKSKDRKKAFLRTKRRQILSSSFFRKDKNVPPVCLICANPDAKYVKDCGILVWLPHFPDFFAFHEFCLLMAPETFCTSNPSILEKNMFRICLNSVHQAFKRVILSKYNPDCTFCGFRGAFSGCWMKRCMSAYHLPCAIRVKCHISYTDNSVVCSTHVDRTRDRQKEILKKIFYKGFARKTDQRLMDEESCVFKCVFCKGRVHFKAKSAWLGENVVTNCEDKAACYHYACMQDYVRGCEYDARCQVCHIFNRVTKFHEQIAMQGIYVNDSDDDEDDEPSRANINTYSSDSVEYLSSCDEFLRCFDTHDAYYKRDEIVLNGKFKRCRLGSHDNVLGENGNAILNKSLELLSESRTQTPKEKRLSPKIFRRDKVVSDASEMKDLEDAVETTHIGSGDAHVSPIKKKVPPIVVKPRSVPSQSPSMVSNDSDSEYVDDDGISEPSYDSHEAGPGHTSDGDAVDDFDGEFDSAHDDEIVQRPPVQNTSQARNEPAERKEQKQERLEIQERSVVKETYAIQERSAVRGLSGVPESPVAQKSSPIQDRLVVQERSPSQERLVVQERSPTQERLVVIEESPTQERSAVQEVPKVPERLVVREKTPTQERKAVQGSSELLKQPETEKVQIDHQYSRVTGYFDGPCRVQNHGTVVERRPEQQGKEQQTKQENNFQREYVEEQKPSSCSQLREDSITVHRIERTLNPDHTERPEPSQLLAQPETPKDANRTESPKQAEPVEPPQSQVRTGRSELSSLEKRLLNMEFPHNHGRAELPGLSEHIDELFYRPDVHEPEDRPGSLKKNRPEEVLSDSSSEKRIPLSPPKKKLCEQDSGVQAAVKDREAVKEIPLPNSISEESDIGRIELFPVREEPERIVLPGPLKEARERALREESATLSVAHEEEVDSSLLQPLPSKAGEPIVPAPAAGAAGTVQKNDNVDNMKPLTSDENMEVDSESGVLLSRDKICKRRTYGDRKAEENSLNERKVGVKMSPVKYASVETRFPESSKPDIKNVHVGYPESIPSDMVQYNLIQADVPLVTKTPTIFLNRMKYLILKCVDICTKDWRHVMSTAEKQRLIRAFETTKGRCVKLMVLKGYTRGISTPVNVIMPTLKKAILTSEAVMNLYLRMFQIFARIEEHCKILKRFVTTPDDFNEIDHALRLLEHSFLNFVNES